MKRRHTRKPNHAFLRRLEVLEDRRVLTTFTEITVFEGGLSRSQQVEAADIDGDGDLDAIAISGEGGVTLTNDGSANFGEIVPFQDKLGADARSLEVGDFDGDGDIDAVIGSIAASDTDGSVTLHVNDGAGNFSLGATLMTGADDNFVDGMGSGDLDGDGDLDIIAVGRNSSTIMLIYNDGSGAFSTPQLLTADFPDPRAAHAADMDGDGDLDVLVTSSYGEDETADNRLGWFANNGDGTFTEKQIVDTLLEPRFLDTADFDGDGDLDVALPQQGSNTLSYYANDGTGMLGEAVILDSELVEIERVKAADLDMDGDQDIVATVDGAGVVVWFENDGSANFSTVQVISVDTIQASGLSIGDLDADGDLDVLTSSQFHAKIDVHLNDGSQSFTQTDVTGANVVDPDVALMADFDGDGDLDVLSQSDFDYKIAWYPNNGDETFGDQVIVAELDIDPGTTFWWDIDVTDMDGDGDIDIVATFPTFLIQLAWYENDGAGNFEQFNQIDVDPAAPPGPLEMVIADIDGDGDSDVLVPEYFNSTVSWYQNDGAGVLTPQLVASLDIAIAEVAAGDVDGDGDLDILIGDNALYQDRSVTWFENVNGDGSLFDEVQIIETGVAEIDDAGFADIDGDGDLDVVVASWPTADSDSFIKWFENTDGKGTFGAESKPIASQFEVVEFILADMDGDGDIDVVSPGQNENAVEWFENDGSGVFTAQVVASELNGVGGLIGVGDLNGDGLNDVVVAESDANAIRAYLGDNAPAVDTDLDDDGDTDGSDVDLLCSSIRDGGNVSDLNGDGVVDINDMITMLDVGFNGSFIGDSNLNGFFGTTDLIQVFQEALFETGSPASWAQGDWNCNGTFGTEDLVLAFQEGGFDSAAPAVSATDVAAAVDHADLVIDRAAEEGEKVATPKIVRGVELDAVSIDEVFALDADSDRPARGEASEDSSSVFVA